LLLEVRGLSVRYSSARGEVRAVEDADISMDKGEIVGLAGESGSGKSTLALALMRLLTPPAATVTGEVKFEGQEILSLREEQFRESYRWKKVAMVFQGSMSGFTPVFTIGSQIEEVMRIQGDGGGDEAVEKLLRMVELDPSMAKRYPHELSGGQKQRAFIAMALSLRPQLLIADEPTTALDVITQASIMNLLKSVRRETGISILLITHDLALISEIAERIYIMYAGRIVEGGRSDGLLGHPRHPYTQGLLASTLTLQTTEIRGIPGVMPDLARVPQGCSFTPRCPFAMERCKTERPELRGVGEEQVACWLY